MAGYASPSSMSSSYSSTTTLATGMRQISINSDPAAVGADRTEGSIPAANYCIGADWMEGYLTAASGAEQT